MMEMPRDVWVWRHDRKLWCSEQMPMMDTDSPPPMAQYVQKVAVGPLMAAVREWLNAETAATVHVPGQISGTASQLDVYEAKKRVAYHLAAYDAATGGGK